MARVKSGEPVSIRLRAPVHKAVRSLARQARRPAAQVINDLLEEALRSRRFPGVVFVEGPAGRRAHLAGTGLDVWEVVELVNEYGSPEAVLRDFPRLTRTAIRTAQVYAGEYPEEIQTFLELNARSPETIRREFPHVEVVGA
ncbi:MAG: DUF433 domain-containing protein [Armatimonadota bacterium]|nr:DUF433 domain-containing protein [Armatimonadota bacterium]